MNPIFEIKSKIEEFKLQTGINPNIVYIGYSMRERIDNFLGNRIALIESYPEVFQLTIKVVKTEKLRVGVMI